MGNDWQTVPSAKDKKKPGGRKERQEAPPIPGFDAGGAALAKLDEQWRNKENGASAQVAGDASGSRPGATRGVNGSALSAGPGSFGGLEVDDDSPPPSPPNGEAENGAPNGRQNGAKPKAAKPKKPKAKKVTTAQAAAELDGAEFGRLLQDVETRYRADEQSQLEAVADRLLAAFRDVDIPFNRTVLEQPLSKSADVPMSDVPTEVQSALAGFLARKDPTVLAGFAGTLLSAVFAAVPESASAKTAPPKAKVGLLVALAAILRARPQVLLQLAPALLGNAAAWSTPRRLPFQLWVIHQAARSNLGLGMAVWARVLLPQLLGAELPAAAAAKPAAVPRLGPSAAGLALDYAEQLLELAREGPDKIGEQRLGPATGDARGVWALKAADTRLLRAALVGIRFKDGGAVEPIVPAGAVVAIERACFVAEPSFGPVAARIRLTQLHEELRELQLAGVAGGVASAQESLRLALDSAAAAAEAVPAQDEPVEQAARTLVDLLAVEPDGTVAAWEARHKQQIRGSAAVLAHLQTRPPWLQQLLSNPHRRGVFLRLLQQLRARHRSLQQHGKSWQQKAAARAEAAAGALAGGTRRGAALSAAAGVLLSAAFLALLVFALLRQDAVRELFARVQSTRQGRSVGRAVLAAADWTRDAEAALGRAALSAGGRARQAGATLAARAATFLEHERFDEVWPLLAEARYRLEVSRQEAIKVLLRLAWELDARLSVVARSLPAPLANLLRFPSAHR